jgi:hypothetical protein
MFGASPSRYHGLDAVAHGDGSAASLSRAPGSMGKFKTVWNLNRSATCSDLPSPCRAAPATPSNLAQAARSRLAPTLDTPPLGSPFDH